MAGDIEQLNSRIERAVTDGFLMASSAKNIRALLAGARSDLYFRSVNELVDAAEWKEINDRFYQTLAFGTGGIRGRTIGKIVTMAERGNARAGERPQFPCVGSQGLLSRMIRVFSPGSLQSLLPESQPRMVATHSCSMGRAPCRNFRLLFVISGQALVS